MIIASYKKTRVWLNDMVDSRVQCEIMEVFHSVLYTIVTKKISTSDYWRLLVLGGVTV